MKVRIAVVGASYLISGSAGHSSILSLIRHACDDCLIYVLESSRYVIRSSRQMNGSTSTISMPKRKLGSQSALLGLVLTVEIFFRFLRELIVIRPKLIHAINLDSALVSLVYRSLPGRKCLWVYQVMDLYAYLHTENALLRAVLLSIERVVANSAGLTVTVSEAFARILRMRTSVTAYPGIAPNYLEIRMRATGAQRSIQFSKPSGETWILCSGIIHRKRGLDKIVSFARELGCEVRVVCTGPVAADYRKEFEDLLASKTVKYVGFLDGDAYHDLVSMCDFVAVPYDADEYYRFAPTYKFFDALLFRKPVIATKGTATGDQAERLGVGVAVDFSLDHGMQEAAKRLKEAHIKLSKGDHYAKFAEAQISVFTERYRDLINQAASVK